MAGDWIKMRCDLADDPAVIEMADALGLDEYAITGRLHKLWSWADKHCADGHAKSVTFVWIDRYIGHNGFAACLQQVGWLATTDTGINFPHFDRHNGENAKKRAEAAERKRLERAAAAAAAEAAAAVTAGAGAVTTMSQEKCDKSVTREEKSREEGKSTPLVPSLPAGDLLGGQDATIKAPPSGKPDCPHQEIIKLYHEILPMCPEVRDWTPARQNALRARWNENPKHQDLAYWRKLFEYIAGHCDFLTGKAQGKSKWIANLEWIVQQGNFTKIRERNYEND